MNRFIGIIQARMASSRLPGKVLMKVKNKAILEYVIERVKKSKCDDVLVCTSENSTDDPIEDFCNKLCIKIFRGEENDVLGRFYNALRREKNATAVRITADNPLVDPLIINYLIDIHKSNKNSATSNYFTKSFPNGVVVSIIDFDLLEYMYKNLHEKPVREHIIVGFDKLPGQFNVENVKAPKQWNRPDIRFCIDYEKDLKLFKKIAEAFDITGERPTTTELIEFIDGNKEIKKINYEYAKNGY